MTQDWLRSEGNTQRVSDHETQTSFVKITQGSVCENSLSPCLKNPKEQSRISYHHVPSLVPLPRDHSARQASPGERGGVGGKTWFLLSYYS